MRVCTCLVLVASLLACGGCGKTKSTDELIQDLNSDHEGDRVKAARLLGLRKNEGRKAVPALTAALKDKQSDVRWSAAIGLGYFGEEARDAIPALQEAALRDRDARVREAARVAVSRIDPKLAPSASTAKGAGK